jgi:hypothetical protein
MTMLTLGGVRVLGFITVGGTVVSTPTVHAASHLPGGSDPLRDDLKIFVIIDVSDPLTVRDNIAPADLPVPYNCEIVEVQMKVRTAPANQAIQVAIAKSGAGDEVMTDAVLSSNNTIAAGSKYGGTTTITSGTLVKGSIIRADIDQVGTGTPGSILTVEVIAKRT